MDNLYSISANLSEKSFSVSGSEEFINKYVDFFLDKFTLTVEDRDYKDINNVSHKNGMNDGNKYIQAGIYSIDDDGEVNIHKKVPGKDKAEKTRNIALIVLYAKNEKIVGSQLKNLCEKQSCYDNTNFAKTFERDIENFIKKKVSAKQWTIDLTVNGKYSAEKLLDEMLDSQQGKG